MYMSNYTDLAVTVSAAEGKHRLWRNTTPGHADRGGTTATLAPHTVGYESDEDLDNGFRPAGPDPAVDDHRADAASTCRTSATPSRRARPPTT